MTKVKFLTFVFWSWLCMIPGTVLYVAGSDAVFKFLANGKIPYFSIGAFALFGILLLFLIRYARGFMKRAG